MIKNGTNHRRIGDMAIFPICSPQHIVLERFFNHSSILPSETDHKPRIVPHHNSPA
ncbi:hypothetical protein RHECNPAF_280070 [Rhizobium etli CNPAF512]|nr:hypothetical protein RHECNPAF_280070 [Rhizobium etli CNPAF512]